MRLCNTTHVQMLSLSPMRYVLVRVLVINIANKGKIASLGGIEAIIKAMSTHSDNAAVQDKACGALNHLAANDGMTVSKTSWPSYDLSCFLGVCFSALLLLSLSYHVGIACVYKFSFSRQTKLNDAG
jgi:hypothetical protein